MYSNLFFVTYPLPEAKEAFISCHFYFYEMPIYLLGKLNNIYNGHLERIFTSEQGNQIKLNKLIPSKHNHRKTKILTVLKERRTPDA